MFVSTLAVLATAALAAAIPVEKRQDSAGQTTLYWGQNGGGVVENNDLSTYCASGAGANIIVLAFLYEFGNGQTIASGVIGQSCSIATDGTATGCDDLASAISTCQANGIKIILSLGGASGSYSLTSQQEAQTIGQNLWDAYGNSGSTAVPRPFGNVFVNGWDMDIESTVDGNTYYPDLINTLRGNFASDSANTYVITGAPQCPIPEPNMGNMIAAAQFDMLFIQFYNNPSCSTGTGTVNYNDWKSSISSGASSAAKLFLGVPASTLAATGTDSGAQYYLAPTDLATLVGQFDTDSSFGGVMLWNAGFSDSNVNNGCTYVQEARHILDTGSAC